MASGQRRWAVAAVLLIPGLIVAWMVFLPRLVAGRLEPLVQRYPGWSLTRVGRVGLSVEGPVIHDVVLKHPGAFQLPPARTRLRLRWSDLWRSEGFAPGVRGRTRFNPGAEFHWQVEPGSRSTGVVVRARGLPLAYLVGVLPPFPWYDPGATRMDLELEATVPAAAGTAAPWPVRGSVHVRNLALTSGLLHEAPVAGVDGELQLEGVWRPGDGSLGPLQAVWHQAGARVQVDATRLHWSPPDYEVAARLTLPEQDCDQVLHAVPEELLGAARGFELVGRIGGEARIQVDSHHLEGTVFAIQVENGCRAAAIPGAAHGIDSGAFRYAIRDAEGRLRWRTTGEASPGWSPLAAISPAAVAAVLVQEDAGFYGHAGFSMPAIRASLILDLQAGGTRRGASTVTMQLARNLFLPRHKTLSRKLQEVIFAWWLEQRLSKERILETYFNVVEFGPRLHGIQAAARAYFDCDAAALSPAQGAFLATVLAAPYRAHRDVLQAGGLTAEWRGQTRGLLLRMAEAGHLEEAALQRAMEELQAMRPLAADLEAS